MGRYTGPKIRLSRREGIDLMLKGAKTLSDNNPLKRRTAPPGQHGFTKSRLSDFGLQLREKQKVKRMYGLYEKQFNNVYKKASKSKGLTGEMILRLLEQRLDNVLYRSGIASTRAHGRKIAGAKKVLINGRVAKTPSQIIKVGDVLTFAEGFTAMQPEEYMTPKWLKVDNKKGSIEILSYPVREDVIDPINEQLIVEYYSR